MQRSTITRSALAAGLVLVSAGPLTPAPAAAKPVGIDGGKTIVKATKEGLLVLEGQGISLNPVRPGRVTLRGISFPIVRGRVDTKTLAGKVRHSGGLRFSKGSISVRASNFVVNTRKAAVTAVIGGNRVRLFDLRFTAAAKRKGKRITVPAVEARLSRTAARALNGAFQTTAFERGLLIAAAEVHLKRN